MRAVRCGIGAVICLTGIALGMTSAGAGESSGLRPKPTIVRGSGDIAPTIERYRTLLGPDNGGVAQSFRAGRREINWDAVPNEFSQPNAYPSDFFNAPTEPRARGAVLKTPGDHLGVSADARKRAFEIPIRLRTSGHMVGGGALQPVHTATTLRVRDGRVSITDGPFAETKEQLAGFYMLEAADLDEALKLTAKIPPARIGSIEVRPVRQLVPKAAKQK